MSMTLLEIVQDILSDMNDDEVNSVADTTESLQVANIVKSTYYELMSLYNWPHLETLTTLIASNDSSKPNYMRVGDDVKEVKSIRYDKRKAGETTPSFSTVHFLDKEEFLNKVNTYPFDSDTIQVTDFSGVVLKARTNAHPTYWTTFDDNWVVFDSYDSSVDTALQSSKTQVLASKYPVFQLDDSYVPDLPTEAFPMLVAEAKSAAFARLKEQPDNKSEQQAFRQRARMVSKSWKVSGGFTYPNYGRRSVK